MSQNMQQQVAAAVKPKARKDWELFWRIVAGLMLLIIAWVVWVLYQITPRQVATPLAYASQIKPIGNQPTAAAPAPEASATLTTQPAAEAAGADRAMALAQEAARSGAHQASADVQAAALGNKAEALLPALATGEGLRLATEISVPPAGKHKTSMNQEGKPEGAPAAPAAAGAAGKARP